MCPGLLCSSPVQNVNSHAITYSYDNASYVQSCMRLKVWFLLGCSISVAGANAQEKIGTMHGLATCKEFYFLKIALLKSLLARAIASSLLS